MSEAFLQAVQENTRSRLTELAKVLETSADYLLTGKEMGLDIDEMELISIFRNFKGNSKEIALQQIYIPSIPICYLMGIVTLHYLMFTTSL